MSENKDTRAQLNDGKYPVATDSPAQRRRKS